MDEKAALKDFVSRLDSIIDKHGKKDYKEILQEVKQLKDMFNQRPKVEVTNLHKMPQPIVNVPQRMKIMRPDWMEEMITRIVKDLTPKEAPKKEEFKQDYNDDELGFIVDKSASKTYIGYAKPGSSESEPVWRIKLIREDKDKNTICEWADKNADFDNVWSRRSVLKYG